MRSVTALGIYEFCAGGKSWRISGPNSLTTFENVSLPIISPNFSLRCDHEFKFGEYAFEMPVAMALPRNSDVLNVRWPESFLA